MQQTISVLTFGKAVPPMNSSMSSETTLETLAQMPFLTAGELAAIAGMPDRTARDVLHRLRKHRCIDGVSHVRPDATRVSRYCLAPTGIEELAAQQLNGTRPVDIVREQDLTSREGRQYLAPRLDVVESMYRIALDAAALFEDRYEMKFTWRWERLGPLYATMQLQDGRVVAMSRLGSTHDGDAIRSRFRVLRRMHHRGSLHTTLLLVPGPVEMQRALNYMYDGDVHGVFVATESELLESPLGSSIWHTPGTNRTSIASVLEQTPASAMPDVRRPADGRTMPSASIAEDVAEADLAVCDLTVPARRIVRALFDFPFIRVDNLCQLLDFSEGHMGRELAGLRNSDLIHRLRFGRTARQRHGNGTRIVLSNRGRTYLRETDRSGSAEMASWHVVPNAAGDPDRHIQNFLVTGGNARVLAQQLVHTSGTYSFLALLAISCRESITWSMVQALPAHRWERAVKYARRHGRPSRVKPDATFILSHPDGYRSFVLEFERSATSDNYREKKLRPYQRYYGAADAGRDFVDGRPTCLFVFEKREYASGFVSFASRTRPALPILVSSLDDLEESGNVFSPQWMCPWFLDAGAVPLMSLT